MTSPNSPPLPRRVRTDATLSVTVEGPEAQDFDGLTESLAAEGFRLESVLRSCHPRRWWLPFGENVWTCKAVYRKPGE